MRLQSAECGSKRLARCIDQSAVGGSSTAGDCLIMIAEATSKFPGVSAVCASPGTSCFVRLEGRLDHAQSAPFVACCLCVILVLRKPPVSVSSRQLSHKHTAVQLSIQLFFLSPSELLPPAYVVLSLFPSRRHLPHLT